MKRINSQGINSLRDLDDFYKVTKAIGLSTGKKVDYVQTLWCQVFVKKDELEFAIESKRLKPYQYNYLGITYLFYAHIEGDVIYILATQYSRQNVTYEIYIMDDEYSGAPEPRIDNDYLNALIEVDEFLSGKYIDRELNIG